VALQSTKVKAEAGKGLRKGQLTPSHLECCKLPQGVWGRAPEAKRFCSILTAMDDLCGGPISAL